MAPTHPKYLTKLLTKAGWGISIFVTLVVASYHHSASTTHYTIHVAEFFLPLNIQIL